MGTDPEHEKLDDLAARIREASAKPVPVKEGDTGQTTATRIGFDFMGSVVGGMIIGALLDHVFETKPWCLVGFAVLGFVVGVVNVGKALMGPKPE